MAISRDEIDKYIFDPENPKQCKSYNLLLVLAEKKNTKSFFSPDFLQYFFAEQITNSKQFNKELWDKPDNYNNLSPIEKLDLFHYTTNSYGDLEDIIKTIDFNIDKILNYSFVNYLNGFSIKSPKDYSALSKLVNIKYLQENMIIADNEFSLGEEFKKNIYDENYVIFANNLMNILEFKIYKTSVLITLEKNIDKFLESTKDHNIKPIFLKKIEDVDILLNVLEQDLKKEKQKTFPQETISTLNEITIKDFFSIKDINLKNLKDKREIYIVGENGDGKSLLLQAIAVGLKGTQEDGLKEFRAIEDKYTVKIENSEDCKNNFLAYGSSRNNSCQLKEDTTGYLTLFSGEYDLKSPTKWLQYLDYSEQKENDNVITVVEAKKLLQELLNSDIQIDISPDKVTFTEKGSEVSFEQLSAGYRGVITIICDLIARLSEKQQVESIADFQGIVLIDEVELHLHPKWQYSFMNKLRETFPLIQFIVTTHSPTVLLGASNEATFYKIYKENGETKISQPMNSIKNFMANNLSTSPLFDMNTARARNSDDKIKTDEDYIYTKIHEIISERVKGKKAIIEDEIVDMVNEELDKYLKENDL